MDDTASAAAALEAEILARIPLASAMGLRIRRYAGDELEMAAPLAPNVNDKGCAFGGSISSLLTLAGWGLIVLGLRGRGFECDLYVGDSHLRYQEPVWGELRGIARFEQAGALDALCDSLAARGKGNTRVVCELAGERRAATTLTARFFAVLRGGG